MSSFKDGLRRSGQSVLDARAQNLYEMTKIEEERFIQECKMKVLRIKNELNKHRDLSVKSTTSLEVGNGPIPSTKPVREVNDPNNKFNEFQKTLRAIEFDVNLFQHSLLVDSTFIPHHYTHRRVLVITHRDEITSQFNDELLSGDWEEQFNSIQTSYYDKLTV